MCTECLSMYIASISWSPVPPARASRAALISPLASAHWTNQRQKSASSSKVTVLGSQGRDDFAVNVVPETPKLRRLSHLDVRDQHGCCLAAYAVPPRNRRSRC